jgi:hypothetical protein
MENEKIAVSTGEVDKRTKNGNNGTRRGPDKKPRKKAAVLNDLTDEAKAGLRKRMEMVIEYYGNTNNLVRRLGMTHGAVRWWLARGRISPEGARRIHRDYKKNGRVGFTASFCRPDLKFDTNGKCVGGRNLRKEFIKK